MNHIDLANLYNPDHWLRPWIRSHWIGLAGTDRGPYLWDATGRSNGTLTNFGFTSASGWGSGARPGALGQCLRFDGSNDRVDLANLSTTTTTFTFACWANISGTGTRQTIFAATSAPGIYIHTPDAGANYYLDYFYSTDHDSSTPIALNVWNHLAVSVIGGSNTFYINGVSAGTSSSATAFTPTRMGNDGFSDLLAGQLDDLLIVGRSTSSAEVTQLYQESRAGWLDLINRVEDEDWGYVAATGNRRRRVLIGAAA